MDTNHHKLLQAFRETIDDTIELPTILSSVEQSDKLEVENPYINKNENQHQEQRITPSATCRVKIFLDAGSLKGALSSFKEYARYFIENLWVPFTNAKEFKLIQWFIQSETPKTKINDYYNIGLSSSSNG